MKRGVLFNGNNFICLALTEEAIADAIEAYGEAFTVLGETLRTGSLTAALEGDPIQAAFRPVR